MNKEQWEKSHAKRLFDLFVELEKSSYPESKHENLDKRHEMAEKFIMEFGVNHVTVQNYTNMMQLCSAVTLDCFDSKRYTEGDIEVNLGSNPDEIWADRGGNFGKVQEYFDFNEWKWKI